MHGVDSMTGIPLVDGQTEGWGYVGVRRMELRSSVRSGAHPEVEMEVPLPVGYQRTLRLANTVGLQKNLEQKWEVPRMETQMREVETPVDTERFVSASVTTPWVDLLYPTRTKVKRIWGMLIEGEPGSCLGEFQQQKVLRCESHRISEGVLVRQRTGWVKRQISHRLM